MGDGNVVNQARNVTGFNSVDVSSALEVFVTQDSTFSVKVEADNNLQEFIEVYKEGEVLHVRQANNINLDPSKDIKIYVSAPAFRRFEVSGASGIRTQNRITSTGTFELGLSGACHGELDVKAPKVAVDLSGASNVSLRGETKDLDIEGSGSSDIKAFELLAENVTVDISGAGNVEVFASAKLSASASGASDIKYKGGATVNSDVSGAGSVKKVD